MAEELVAAPDVEVLSKLDLNQIFRMAKKPSKNAIEYVEGYFDGAMDVYNALMTAVVDYQRKHERN